MHTKNLSRSWLVALLKTGDVQVSFTKKDGTDRAMRCTLREEVLPPHEPRKPDPRYVSVWDLDAKGWRNINVDTLKDIKAL